MRQSDARSIRIAGLLVAALAARLVVIASLPVHTWFAGGDGPWYVRQAWLLARGALVEPLRTVGPLYPLVLAAVWRFFPGDEASAAPLVVGAGYLTVVRLLQALLGVATIAVVMAMARAMGLGRRGAIVVAVGVGLGPAFVMEPFLIRTETVFMLLFSVAVWLHVRAARSPSHRGFALAGVISALAAMARPVLLLLPGVLAVHLLVACGWKRGSRLAGALLVGALLALAPWHVALYRSTGHWLPEGFSANLWIGAQSDGGPLEVPAFHELEEQLTASGRSYLGGAFRTVADDPLGWATRRAGNLLGAMMQPHGTSDLGGPSMKAEVVRWLREDRSVAGFLGFAGSPTFAVRVLIYVFHVTALVLACLGVFRTRHRWRAWLPIYAAAMYLPLVHLFLSATPRYLFPAQPFLWVLAAAGLASPLVMSGVGWPRPAETKEPFDVPGH
jgi:hypothetical protein